MIEEAVEEWQAFRRALLTRFPIDCVCEYCRKVFISDEFTAHLINSHPKEAEETKRMCRKRLDWEAQARWMTDEEVESLQ